MSISSNKKPLSFGFSKKIEKQPVIEKSAIAEKHVVVQEETDFVVELDGKKVKSVKPKEEPKELVIPLIQKNIWHGNKQDKSKESKKKDGKDGARRDGKKTEGIDDEAVKELLKEAAKHNDEWQERGQTDLNLSIPLLMRNKVPEGYEEDEKLDVSLRPTETSGEDYDEVPIEQFGMAMLRGMGFKEEEGIGDKMKKTVKPIEVNVRPKGQGLGADKRPVMPKKQVRRKPGDKKVEEEPVGIAKGVGVLVTSGPHKNLYGKIEGVDDDNARVVIKLAISNQSVTLSQYGVQLVDKDEYKKHAKDLGKFSKGHNELAKRKEKEGSEKDRKRDKRREENGHGYDSSSSRNRHQDKDDRRHRKRHNSEDRSDHERTKRKHREDDSKRTSEKYRDSYESDDRKRSRKKYDDGDDKKGTDYDRRRDRYDKDRETDRRKHTCRDKYGRDEEEDNRRHDDRKRSSDEEDHSVSKPVQYWLRPDLRVRFIDKTFKKGKYYNSKVSIIDVVTRDQCSCRTEEGKLLEDIHQDMVETLIPKSDPGYIMVVNGQLKGQLGTVLKRDKTNCKAAVQLLQDRDQIVKLDYNDICEYVGDIQANDDY